MDKLRAMEAFVNIVEKGSLTAAAEALGTSPPSAVRALAALERVLGARLLNRTTRRIALTDEGRAYYDRARRILADVADAEAAASAKQAVPQGRLAIGAPVMFGRLHAAPLVAEFVDRHPGIKVELLLMDRVVNLVEEGLDATLRIGALADSTLVALEVGRTRRVVCASPACLKRHGVPRVPADLARRPCIRFTGLVSGEWEFKVGGKPVRVRVDGPIATNQVDAAIDACVQGLGYGMFLCYQVGAHQRAGRLRYVLEAYEPEPNPVSLVYPQARLVSARLRAFIDWIVPRLRARLGGD
ncbi:MAG TPA: LysR family transcriptional regulator [Burkholderiales bacterium]|nr:LysR family transcriptional regulator [Burkholderiales bacterium]